MLFVFIDLTNSDTATKTSQRNMNYFEVIDTHKTLKCFVKRHGNRDFTFPDKNVFYAIKFL